MESANLMVEFANTTKWGLLIADGAGVVRDINPAAAAIFGYSSDVSDISAHETDLA